MIERRVKLLKIGRRHAVRFPCDFKLSSRDAIMRRAGNKLIIEPAPLRSLSDVLKTFSPLDMDFSHIADPRPDPVEI